MDPMTILGLGQAAAGLFGGLFGGGQKRQANKMLKGLQYPTYDIPAEVLQNQRMAQARANSGLPSAQYNQAFQNIQRSRNNAIKNASDRRSALYGISTATQAANDSTLGLDVADAQQRIQNEKQLMDTNNITAQYQDKKWQNNIKDKYDRDYNYAMSLKGSGQQNVLNGVDKGIGGLSQVAYGLFGNKTPQYQNQTTSTSGSQTTSTLLGGRRFVFNPNTGQYELR